MKIPSSLIFFAGLITANRIQNCPRSLRWLFIPPIKIPETTHLRRYLNIEKVPLTELSGEPRHPCQLYVARITTWSVLVHRIYMPTTPVHRWPSFVTIYIKMLPPVAPSNYNCLLSTSFLIMSTTLALK